MQACFCTVVQDALARTPLSAPAQVVQKLRRDFPAPTPIQAAAWPAAMAGQDLVGIAETGSGKTLACARLWRGVRSCVSRSFRVL